MLIRVDTKPHKSTVLINNHDGNTYSYEVKYAVESEDGYVLFTDANNGCGYTETIIVKACERRE